MFIGDDMFSGAIEVFKTQDYKKFKLLECNRECKPGDVRKLEISILKDNRLKDHPIQVTAKGYVFDGQHRLKVAEKNNLPIYYTVNNKMTEEDIIHMNTNKKNWKATDFIHFYKQKGFKNYEVMARLMENYPKVAASTLLTILSNVKDPKDGGSRLIYALQEGKLNIANLNNAQKVLRYCHSMYPKIDFSFDRSFVLAMYKCHNTGKYDHEIIMKKLDYAVSKFHKCNNIEMYIEMFEDIYNYRTRQSDRVPFVALTKGLM
jgi:hypothetical protein